MSSVTAIGMCPDGTVGVGSRCVTTHNGASVPETARETILDNLRAYRARRRLDQADVVAGMRALGFTNWHRQTMSKVERGERSIRAEEIIGLAKVLHTFPAHLLADDPRD
jgi:hypothetical protein